jgi:hypothetical protein
MTFLPIVERELRVAARKRSTFWLRIVAALVALVIGSGFLILTVWGPLGLGTVSLGKGLFAALTWLSLGAALSAGLFLTSDCLSEEKREGTLGLLFLTDLRGYDVVFGKLLATSLRGFYALLAVFPILALTLLLGGVTGAQFWQTSLALVNAMFISLAAGLFVSVVSRDSQKALAGAVFLLALLVASGPAIDATLAAVNQRSFSPVLSLSSPGYLFLTASAWGKNLFWPGVLVNQAIAWLLLGVTCVLLPRAWQEKTAKTTVGKGRWRHWCKFGGAKRRARLHRTLLGVNPVLWLACRERWQALSFWAMAILMAGGVAVFSGHAGQPMWSTWWIAWSFLSGAFALVLYLGAASQASRFFVEAQHSGLIELLLATPLTVKQILDGQWRALLRMFGVPLAVWLALQLLGTFLAQESWRRLAATAPGLTTVSLTNSTSGAAVTSTTTVTITPSGVATTNAVPVGGFAAPNRVATASISVAGTLTVVANLTALVWFGMWMGLNSKNSNLAALKTILFVQIIPWFGVSFASAMVVPLFLWPRVTRGIAASPSLMMVWYPLITSGVATLLYLAKDLGFWLWARRKLHSEFRERAVRAVAPVRLALPPPLPRVGSPPIIASG